jgi:hypothetical protein
LNFSDLTYTEEQETSLAKDKFCQCMSFGETASAISIDWGISQFFKLFYKGFSKDILI